MGSSPQTLITERKLPSRECELAGSARLSPLLEHSNTVKENGGWREGVGGAKQQRKKHIRPSHSALLPGGTFGLCGEVSALYSQQTLNARGPRWRSHLLPWRIQSGAPSFFSPAQITRLLSIEEKSRRNFDPVDFERSQGFPLWSISEAAASLTTRWGP